MKRFMMLSLSASVCLAMLFASSQAQEKKSNVRISDKIKIGPKYAQPDLAVITFTGAYDGTNFNVGGIVKNVGNAEYSRTRSTSGAFEGRQIKLYSVNPLKIGRSMKLLRTISIPSLKANQTWSTPTMKFAPRELYGTGNPKFLLTITQGDANRDNDSKETIVSYVR